MDDIVQSTLRFVFELVCALVEHFVPKPLFVLGLLFYPPELNPSGLRYKQRLTKGRMPPRLLTPCQQVCGGPKRITYFFAVPANVLECSGPFVQMSDTTNFTSLAILSWKKNTPEQDENTYGNSLKTGRQQTTLLTPQ